MRMDYRFDTKMNKLKIAAMTWMLRLFGEGGSEITNQGRSDHSQSFSQETGAIGQRVLPRNGDTKRPMLRELSAGCTTNFDPISPLSFFDSNVFFQTKAY